MLTAPLTGSPPEGAPGGAGQPSPWPLLVGVAAAAVLVKAASGPLIDVDVYWHLLVGQDILDGVAIREAGRGWSVAPIPDVWVSSQWLAETALALLYRSAGFTGLILWRFLTTALALATLWWSVSRAPRPVRSAWVPFTLGALLLATAAQERSQQVTFILAPLLGLLMVRGLRDGWLPRWWLVVPVVIVWANVHGGWVLVPVTLGLVTVGRWFDRSWRDRTARSAAVLTVVALASGAVTPLGPANLWAPFAFSQAAATTIAEWQRVTPFHPYTVPLLLVVAAFVVLWSRGPVRPPRSELLVVGLLTMFAMTAWRNVMPVLLMLAPVLSFRIGDSLTGPDRPVSPFIRRASIGLVAVGAAVGLVVAATADPLPADQLPTRLIERIAALPGDQRVLNDYNQAGAVLWFGRPPKVKVAIDGRTERHGADYIERYQDMVAMKPGWESLFDELAPTAALLPDDSALSAGLVAERGWREVDRQAGEVLLLPPAS